MEYYSASKKNGHASTWVNLRMMLLSERSQIFLNEDILYIARNPTF